MEKRKRTTLKKKRNSLLFLAGLFAGSVALFGASIPFEGELVHLNSQLPFITLHNIMELVSVIISCSIFFITYFTYEQAKSLRLLIIGVIFLQTGVLDMLHLLSISGMPDFLTSNSYTDKGNTFWILGRLTNAVGMLIFVWIPKTERAYAHKNLKRASSRDLTQSAIARKDYNKHVVLILAFLFAAGLSTFAFACPGILMRIYKVGGDFNISQRLLSILITLLYAGVSAVYIAIYTKTSNRLYFLLAEAGVLNIFTEFALAFSPHVYDTYLYLTHLYKIAAFILVFRVLFIFTIQNPYTRLSRSEKRARFYAERLDRIVENRIKQIKNANTALLRDLAYAKNIHQAMLPTELHFNGKVGFQTRYFPARQLGGNFYSLFKVSEDEVGILLAKSSIFGTGSAMLTVFIHQSFLMIQEINQKEKLHTSPTVILRQLRKFITEADFGKEIGIGLLYAVYHFQREELSYAVTGWEARGMIPSWEQGTVIFSLGSMVVNDPAGTGEEDLQDTVIKLHPGDHVLFSSGNPLAYGIKHSLLPIKGKETPRKEPATMLSAAMHLLSFEGDCSSISEDLVLLLMHVEEPEVKAM